MSPVAIDQDRPAMTAIKVINQKGRLITTSTTLAAMSMTERLFMS